MAECRGEEACERRAAARSSRRAGRPSGRPSLRSRQPTPLAQWLHRPLRCLKHPNGVAQFRGAFVELARYRAFHLTLHNLELSQRPLGPYFIEPLFEESDFTALTGQLGEVGMLEGFDDCVATLLDFTHAVSKLAFAQEDRRLRPCVHHQHIGSKLLKIPDNLLPLAMLVDKSEEIEISLSVADYSSKFIELKEADVAVVILNTFLLQLRTLLGRQFVTVTGCFGEFGTVLVIGK